MAPEREITRFNATVLCVVGLGIAVIAERFVRVDRISTGLYLASCIAFLIMTAIDYEKRRKEAEVSLAAAFAYSIVVLIVGVIVTVNVRLFIGLPI